LVKATEKPGYSNINKIMHTTPSDALLSNIITFSSPHQLASGFDAMKFQGS